MTKNEPIQIEMTRRFSVNGIDDSNIFSHVANGFQNYIPVQEKRQKEKQLKIKKDFKDEVSYWLESMKKSVFTGIVILIDLVMNFFLCILNILDSYIDDLEHLKPLLTVELIITIYLLLSGIYEFIVQLHFRKIVWIITFFSSIITLIPLIYFFIHGKSIFSGWTNHDHVSSLCFVRIFSLDMLITEALVYFWVGENQKKFHIVDKIANTIVHLFSLLYFASSMFRLLEGYETTNDFHYFHNCFYFTVVTIITVGFGDITPKTVEGRLFCSFYILCFFVIIPMLLTSLVSAFKKRNQSSLTFTKDHILYTGSSDYVNLFIRKIKADLVVMLPEMKEHILSKRKYKRYFYEGDPVNEKDLERSNSKYAYHAILTSDGDDKKTFVRCLSIMKHCNNCSIFVYLTNSDLFNVFRDLGVEVLCKEYVRLMLVGELCIPHYIDVMRCLFSIKTKKNEINVLRNFKTPSYFVGMTGNTVMAELMNEVGIVVVGIMTDDKMYYFDCDKELTPTDRIFVISNEEKYRRIKDKIIKPSSQPNTLQMEGGDQSIYHSLPFKHFQSRYALETVIVEYIEEKNHKLVIGYHRGTDLILRKFRERNKEFIYIVVENLTEVQYDWISLSYVDNLFIIVGNLFDQSIYQKLNIVKASSIMILPSDPLGQDESSVIIISTLVHSLIEQWKSTKYYESQFKNVYNLKDIPIVCELVNQESERFVNDFASCYCDSFACEMICNMVRHRFNNRIWLDFSTVTSDVTIVNIPVPGIMIGCIFQSVFVYLLEKRIKCLGILKISHGRWNIYSKRSYKLKEDDMLICVVKQHDVISSRSESEEDHHRSVQSKILDPKRLNEIDNFMKNQIVEESDSSTSLSVSSTLSISENDEINTSAFPKKIATMNTSTMGGKMRAGQLPNIISPAPNKLMSHSPNAKNEMKNSIHSKNNPLNQQNTFSPNLSINSSTSENYDNNYDINDILKPDENKEKSENSDKE